MKQFKSVVVTIASATNTKGIRYIAKSELGNNTVVNNNYRLNDLSNRWAAVNAHLEIVNSEDYNVYNGIRWVVEADAALPNSDDRVFIISTNN